MPLLLKVRSTVKYCQTIMRNIEIKAKVKDVKSLIEKAKELSKSKGEEIKQHDIFYNIPNGRLKLRIYKVSLQTHVVLLST